jgi:hypothetical protein
MLVCNILKGVEFPSSHTARTNISNLSAFNHIIESSHDLLSGSIAVQSMDLKHVNVGSQSSNTPIDSIEDVLSAQSNLVYHRSVIGAGTSNCRLASIICDTKIALAQDDNLVSRDVVLFKSLSDDLLGPSIRIDVCCIPCVQSDIVCMLQEW